MNEKIENLSWIFGENNRTFSLGNFTSNYQCYDAIDTISDTIRLNSVFTYKILYRRSGVKMKKHYNIMTSTDCNLIKQVEILIYSIGCNIHEAEIDFFIFHRGISMNELGGIDILSEYFSNIVIHSVQVPDVEKYDYIASFGGNWAGEAYFSLCAHELLPDWVERVLYLDAGDILVLGDQC